MSRESILLHSCRKQAAVVRNVINGSPPGSSGAQNKNDKYKFYAAPLTEAAVSLAGITSRGRGARVKGPVPLGCTSSWPPIWRRRSCIPRKPTPLSFPGARVAFGSFGVPLSAARDSGRGSILQALHADGRGAAARMAMNVGQTFLHNAKEGNFQVTRQATEILGQLQIDIDLAALAESVDIPLQSRFQADLIEQRGMQKMRDGPNLDGELLQQTGVIFQGFCGFRT